jgi:hypothetical protein
MCPMKISDALDPDEIFPELCVVVEFVALFVPFNGADVSAPEISYTTISRKSVEVGVNVKV